MNINQEINKLKDLQNLTGGYTEVAIENIKMAPFLFLDYLESADFLLGEDEIRVYLVPKKSIFGWFYRTFRKTEINHNLNTLAKYIYFWVPRTKKLPTINFYWGKIPDEYK